MKSTTRSGIIVLVILILSITGYSMVLSECSYNMACDWLERTLAKYGVDIYDCKVDSKTGFTILRSGKYSHILGDFKPCRKYFYDESRGVLLGE